MAGAAGGQLYYCYECQRTVRPSSISDLVCPDCNGGFLEEWSSSESATEAAFPRHNSSPWNYVEPEYGGGSEDEGPNPYFMFQGLGQRHRGYPQDMSPMLEAMSSFLQHMQGLPQNDANRDNNRERGMHIRLGGTDLGAVNPLLLFQGQIQNILGGNVEVFVDNGGGVGPGRLPGNIGDYYFGPAFEQLIQQLSENDQNRYGAPPASKSAIDGMPNVKVTENLLGTDASQCAVCKDEFELHSEVKQMPCKHMYHPDCILPWLAQHNSCPVCRYELPTDDPDYEQARIEGVHSTPFLGNTGAGGVQGERDRPPGGFSVRGRPRALGARSFLVGSDGRANATEQQNNFSAADVNGPTERGNSGGSGTGRRFPLPFSWFRSASTSSQSPADAQAESSSQAYSGETVSSGPEGERNGGVSRALRTDEDGDTVMSETRLTDVE